MILAPNDPARSRSLAEALRGPINASGYSLPISEKGTSVVGVNAAINRVDLPIWFSQFNKEHEQGPLVGHNSKIGRKTAKRFFWRSDQRTYGLDFNPRGFPFAFTFGWSKRQQQQVRG